MRIATIILIMCATLCKAAEIKTTGIYPVKEERAMSPGKTTYYINPAGGNDTHTGLTEEQPWKTLHEPVGSANRNSDT